MTRKPRPLDRLTPAERKQRREQWEREEQERRDAMERHVFDLGSLGLDENGDDK